ncbi:MAG: hypothetical protein ABSG67_03365 [Thermoguttaceae bacterium]|jgi:hypothetical protein
MFRGICAFTITGLLFTAPAWAQKPAAKTEPPAPAVSAAVEKPSAKPQTVTPAVSPGEIKAPITSISPGELKATPEMWFYEQYLRQYQDPKMAVRANAEFQADQRQRRLAAMHWFGMSNSRPRACSDPMHGDYSPGWTSNNSTYPNRWDGIGPSWYIARPVSATVYTY